MSYSVDRERAEANLQSLKENRYPGRLIILGVTEDEHQWVQVYGLMGRRPSSRNRRARLIGEGGLVTIEPAAPPQEGEDLGNPELIYYDATMRAGIWDVVSNGKQTNDIATRLAAGEGFRETLERWSYEPDAPNYTQRIVGAINRRTGALNFGRITKDANSDAAIRHVTPRADVPTIPGIGYCFHTYEGDAKILLPFTDTPYVVPLQGSVEEIARTYWDSLNADNRVALIVKSSPTQPTQHNNSVNVITENIHKEVLTAS